MSLPMSARKRIAAALDLHQPVDEEAEIWIDGPGEDLHAELFPDCTDDECRGHLHTMKVCQECGYTHDGDQALYRPWPCPTVAALSGAAT